MLPELYEKYKHLEDLKIFWGGKSKNITNVREYLERYFKNGTKGSYYKDGTIQCYPRRNRSFYDLFFANRNINYAYFYFIDDKLCKVKLIINDYSNLKKMIEDYNRIKSEINSKYYKTENDFINFEPPAYPTEIIDNEYEYQMKKELIEYTSFWNFKSNSEFDDYIFLKIFKNLEIQIIYEHGELNRKFLEKQKTEW